MTRIGKLSASGGGSGSTWTARPASIRRRLSASSAPPGAANNNARVPVGSVSRRTIWARALVFGPILDPVLGPIFGGRDLPEGAGDDRALGREGFGLGLDEAVTVLAEVQQSGN